MQIVSTTNSILARIKLSTRKAFTKLLIVFKVFRVKEETRNNPIIRQEVPIFPWTKLATDLFHFEGDLYLLIVDYTSQFPIVHKLTSMTGHNVAEHFKQIFAKYGWPGTIISDNRLCYTSQIFKGLMGEYQVTTSQAHPTTHSQMVWQRNMFK